MIALESWVAPTIIVVGGLLLASMLFLALLVFVVEQVARAIKRLFRRR